MDFEKYTRVFEKLDTRIKPGESIRLDFDWSGDSPDRLFLPEKRRFLIFGKASPTISSFTEG